MGNYHNEKKIKVLFNKIKTEIKCPICGKILPSKMTYIELNNHLSECQYLQNNKTNDHNNDTNDENNNNDTDENENDNDTDENNNETDENNNDTNENNNNDTISSPPENSYKVEKMSTDQNSDNQNKIINDQKRKNSVTYSDNYTTLNDDFQLVIDYADTQNYGEMYKTRSKTTDFIERYSNLKRFILYKKEQMDFNENIVVKNVKDFYFKLKVINIYFNNIFILRKEKNKSCRDLFFSLNDIVNQFIETNIKLNSFNIVDENNIGFSLSNKKIDYEIIGIIIAILFIYNDIKLNYTIPIFLCKILVNQRINLGDIRYINIDYYQKLFDLKQNIDDLKINYVYEGNELIVGGESTYVDKNNVSDYIEKIINYELLKYKENINLIKNTVFQCLPKKDIYMLSAEEIFLILNRKNNYNSFN